MFIIISGPSGVGKTPLTYYILNRYPNIKKVQSYTTRKVRSREVAGTYIYLTHQQFEQKIKENFFFEYNKVHKDQEYYGTSLKSYEDVVKDGCVAIKDIDVDSYKSVKQNKNIDVVGIFLKIKNRGILSDRLRERGETEHTIAIRLNERVDYEYAQSKYFDYVLYTDNFEKACEEVEEIIDKEFKKRGIEIKKREVDKKIEHIF